MDTEMGQLRLPDDKLRCVKSLLREWGAWCACTRKELESLIGLLNHACKVVRSGRSFLRCMIDLLHSVLHPPNSPLPIRFNQGFRADCQIHRKMERSLFPAPTSIPARGQHDLRCIRLLGLWCVMHILRCLVFIEATFNFSIAPVYISTKETSLVIVWLPFSQRCHMQTTFQHQPQLSCWTALWSNRPTRPVQPGARGSGIFSARISQFYSINLQSRLEKILYVLHEM